MTDRTARRNNDSLLAGHETTRTPSTLDVVLLGQHPEVEEKLVEELQRVLGGGAYRVRLASIDVYRDGSARGDAPLPARLGDWTASSAPFRMGTTSSR